MSGKKLALSIVAIFCVTFVLFAAIMVLFSFSEKIEKEMIVFINNIENTKAVDDRIETKTITVNLQPVATEVYDYLDSGFDFYLNGEKIGFQKDYVFSDSLEIVVIKRSDKRILVKTNLTENFSIKNGDYITVGWEPVTQDPHSEDPGDIISISNYGPNISDLKAPNISSLKAKVVIYKRQPFAF